MPAVGSDQLHRHLRLGPRLRASRGGGHAPLSEKVHPRADELDGMSAGDFLQVMHAEDLNAVRAIAPALEQLARAVDQVADRLRTGGRLHYFGAGTSGMIAALDAVECPATFGVDRDLVRAHVATEPEQ